MLAQVKQGLNRSQDLSHQLEGSKIALAAMSFRFDRSHYDWLGQFLEPIRLKRPGPGQFSYCWLIPCPEMELMNLSWLASGFE